MKALLALIAALAAPEAQAAIITGRDCANQDLICDGSAICGGADTCSNNDQLQGTFTRVRFFSIPAGTTVYVYPATPFVVHASTIAIAGTLDGSGRGMPGGSGGGINSAGVEGVGGGPSPGFAGGGAGAAASKGGAGGGHGGVGGQGTSSGGGAAAGAAYGSTGVEVGAPLSADDVSMGSGGGGGGGGAGDPGGGGGAGGAAIYLEASSITFSGSASVLANGGIAPAVTDTDVGVHPGGGGGGAGGGILIRATRVLQPGGAGSIAASGGKGADTAIFVGGIMNPGGGGAGGRIKVFYRESSGFTIAFSTGYGTVGTKLSGTYDSTGTVNNGSSGTVSFGIIASSPIAPSVSAVYVGSITWAWSNVVDWGDAPSASRGFRVYPSSASAPISAAQASAAAAASSVTENGLQPNTTYTRVIAAATDWGDSLPSFTVSTFTLASPPGAAASPFSDVQERQLTFNWAAGSPANPSYTVYEVWRSTVADFSAGVSAGYVAALSSTPLNLAPETLYYFRVRAVNLAGTLTGFGAVYSVATSTTPPGTPGVPAPDSPFSYDGTATFRWSAASASSGIKDYLLEIGTFPGGADFLSVSTGMPVYAASGLATGRTYYARVRARSNADVSSGFSEAGPPVSVFITTQEAAIAKPRNWPNPFDPAQGPTNIGFSLAQPADVTLTIFTLQGVRVYRESRRFGSAGNQIWLWNGSGDSGRRVTPGGYIGVIEKSYGSGSESQRFKMAVLY